MRILGTPFEDIDAAFIERLVSDRIPESVTHDYKSHLPDPRNYDAKHRLLASASAFANTLGGIIVFGVDAPIGQPWKDDGLANFDEDRDVLRLKDLLRSGIDPWLPRAMPRILRRVDRDPFLLLGIPFSLAYPHAVSATYQSGFWYRDDRGNHPMSVSQLRAAFLGADKWREEVESFRQDRVEFTRGPVIPLNWNEGVMLLHVLPLGRLKTTLDMPALIPAWREYFHPKGEQIRVEARPNLDGWLVVDWGSKGSDRYIQIFRHGGVEFCWTLANFRDDAKAPLDGARLEEELVGWLERIFTWLDAAAIGAPFAVCVSIVNAHGCRLMNQGRRVTGPGGGFDRERVLIPAFVLEGHFPSDASVACRELLNELWQAAGWDRSPHYDGDRWTLR
jgi:hypothetical protein